MERRNSHYLRNSCAVSSEPGKTRRDSQKSLQNASSDPQAKPPGREVAETGGYAEIERGTGFEPVDLEVMRPARILLQNARKSRYFSILYNTLSPFRK